MLRDDGPSYMAYTEQITFLLFLKMADQPAAALLERIERQRRVSALARKDKRTNNVRSGRSQQSETARSAFDNQSRRKER